MMDSLQILGRNQDFLQQAYGMSPMLGLFLLLMLIDTGLKGWALWRAARMEKLWWFIPLLIVNSMGILPLVFLLSTRGEYERFMNSKSKSRANRTKIQAN